MRDVNQPPSESEDENELERSLERGLRHEPLSPEALDRVRANVFAEFTQRWANASRGRRNRRFAAVAAAVSALVISVLLVSSHSPGAAVAQLEQESGDGVLASSSSSVGSAPVESGAVLHASEEWSVRGPARARLVSGGTLRMAERTVVKAREPHTLELAAGRVYFDFPPGAGRFVVRTAFGSIEHVGTQFEVAQLERGMRVRVREGSVLLHGDKRVVAIDTGMEVLVDQNGGIDRGAYPTYGNDWAWVESIAPSYEIENRQLAEFLAWVARETGRRITFVDTHAREVANHTTLHGSVAGLRPMEALDQVLSTTSLRFQLQGGEIRIASRT
jgi:ferric-dicitrate binding protein FerR (iron transport regulator)